MSTPFDKAMSENAMLRHRVRDLERQLAAQKQGNGPGANSRLSALEQAQAAQDQAAKMDPQEQHCTGQGRHVAGRYPVAAPQQSASSGKAGTAEAAGGYPASHG